MIKFYVIGTLAVPTDASVTQTETSRDDQEQATHKKGITSQIQPDDSDVTINNDHSSPQRSKNNESDTREDAAKEKTKAKNTKKKAKIKNEGNIGDKSIKLLRHFT